MKRCRWWALALFCCNSIAAPVHVLCIGDSITQGGSKGRPEYTYRLPLQRMLRATGRDVDFIGTQKHGLNSDPWPVDFDGDHEGYYGQTTAQVAAHLAVNLPKLAPPDVALIHLGTNDRGWDATKKPLESIIRQLRARNPKVIVLVADPPLSGVFGHWVRWAIRITVQGASTPQSPVVLVEPPDRWDAARDTFDGIHPNERGQVRQAVQWLATIGLVKQ
jgi:acyl-CoA thioesterase I